MRLVWQDDSVSVAQQLVADYDLIPRPQGVGMRKHRIVKYRPFDSGHTMLISIALHSGMGMEFRR